jgi:hypothetical protein
MQPELLQQNGRKPGGMPYYVILLVTLVSALVMIGVLGFIVYYLHSDKKIIERKLAALETQKQREELEQKTGAENSKLTLAHNVQEDVLAQIRAATNILTKLLVDSDQLQEEAAALRTNDLGRGVALHPDLVPLARRFYQSELREIPPREEVITRLQAVRRIEQQLLPHRGTAFNPPPDVVVAARNATSWGEQGQLKLAQVRQSLNALVQESKIKVTSARLTPTSVTLDTAVTRLNEQEANMRLRYQEQKADETRAEKIVADAQREADAIRAKLREEQAQAERDRQEREARLKVEETKTQVAVQQKEDQARTLVLRQKASDPAVQAKLAPFITPGYYQFNTISSEMVPLSYKRLQNSGALNPGLMGWQKLVSIASDAKDRVRPRWKMSPRSFIKHPDQVETIKEVQELLIELGPVLVEMGLLYP